MGAKSIESFCKEHGFSRATYYNLKGTGKAPIEMAIGTRRLISDEAAERWRRDREAEAAADRQVSLPESRKTSKTGGEDGN